MIYIIQIHQSTKPGQGQTLPVVPWSYQYLRISQNMNIYNIPLNRKGLIHKTRNPIMGDEGLDSTGTPVSKKEKETTG